MFGFAPGEAGDHVAMFDARIHPEDLELMQRSIEITPDGLVSQEIRIVPPDGAIRWLSCRGEALEDGHGRPEHLSSVIMDVTARKRAEQTLQSSE